MNMTSRTKKIVWTVDPFAKEKDLQRSAARAIKNLTNGSPSIIEPVYFYSAYLTGEYPLDIPKKWVHEIHTNGQKELNKILKHVNLENIKPLHVVSEPYLSMREGVARINEIAKRWKADLIVTSTHARKGIKRLFLGSFAETLLLHSDVPLFFVNPHWIGKFKFKNIIFPTDFSEESKDSFLKVLDIAQTLGSKITLFHKLAFIWPPTIRHSGSIMPLYIDVFNRELEFRQKDALKWAEEAKLKGVSVTPIIDYKQDGSIASSVLQKLKKNPGIIAMASTSGPTKTTLLGSTTRKLVRESPYPIWVLHPQTKAQEKIENIRQIKSSQNEPLFTVTEDEIESDLERIPHVKKSA
jgi:nucleotide-binding universal stress UspA family protein